MLPWQHRAGLCCVVLSYNEEKGGHWFCYHTRISSSKTAVACQLLTGHIPAHLEGLRNGFELDMLGLWISDLLVRASQVGSHRVVATKTGILGLWKDRGSITPEIAGNRMTYRMLAFNWNLGTTTSTNWRGYFWCLVVRPLLVLLAKSIVKIVGLQGCATFRAGRQIGRDGRIGSRAKSKARWSASRADGLC